MTDSKSIAPLMIAPANPTEAAPLLRREFALDTGHGPVERATLRTSALGVVEAWVNGIRSSDELLAPGWTSYEWRVRVVEHDVTDAVAERTVIGLRLGNGWYRGWLGFTAQRAVYGDERAGYAQLEIVFADGHVQTVVTDGTWRAASGEVLADDLYNGETIDARLADGAWRHPGFDDADWDAVHVVDFDASHLVTTATPPVRRGIATTKRAAIRRVTSPPAAAYRASAQGCAESLPVPSPCSVPSRKTAKAR